MSAVGTTTPLRASDAEREAAVARLHHALGEGRLDLAETDGRVAAAYGAVFRDDLPPLLADIPAAESTATGVPNWTAIWTSIVWRARATVWGPSGRPPRRTRAGSGSPP